MKNWLPPLIIVALAGLFLLILFQFHQVDQTLTSPLGGERKIPSLNQWFPQNVLGAVANAPEITAKSALFIDTKTGQVLYSKQEHEKLPIASLAKVMTVLVAIEHRGLDEKLLVSTRASEMEPDEMILLPGEKLTLKELLYGIFLLSANDAAEVLAETSTGDRDEFIKLMNSKAELLGMKNTKFVNPTGLDEDSGNSYSSAYDLAVLARYVIKHYPFLVDISGTEHIILPATLEHQDYDMYSGINLLTTYPGVVGFKTGYTPGAGLTLITLARNNGSPRSAGGAGHEVLGVLLGTENRRDEAKELLDYSFEQLF
ncbi:MAG: D-alanyl-D-alanine carboxypeptidase [Microgenomates group bacterium Gr01-1014_80]|nr:MAG: D-alanyl-D-alanine carboxypeptidase [Microgenomates group bacterium Gr01-1014_80]